MPQIEVTFDIDANGILHVNAKDKKTGKEQRIEIKAGSGLSDEEIKRMVADAETHRDEDKKFQELVTTRNKADQLVHATRSAIKEHGGKVGGDVIGRVEEALADLEKVMKEDDKAAIESRIARLEEVAQSLYAAGSAGQQPGAEADAQSILVAGRAERRRGGCRVHRGQGRQVSVIPSIASPDQLPAFEPRWKREAQRGRSHCMERRRACRMGKGRMEAFTDGVIAVIITIMVLELKMPREATWQALLTDLPVFLSYVLSFVYVGIYWANHHHMLHTVEHVDGKVIWANLFFLFWLSLFPFTTAWLNEAHGDVHGFPAPIPTALYGFTLLMAALSWIPLSRALVRSNGGKDSKLARAIGARGDWKQKISPLMYALGIALAFFAPIISCALYALVAAMWFVPDPRIEHHLKANG